MPMLSKVPLNRVLTRVEKDVIQGVNGTIQNPWAALCGGTFGSNRGARNDGGHWTMGLS